MVTLTNLNGSIVKKSQGQLVPLDLSNMVMYYPFQEGEGSTIHEALGKSNDASMNVDAGWINGPNGYAVNFSTSSATASAPYDSSVTPQGDEPFTYCVWIKPGSNVSGAYFSIHYNDSPHNGVDLWTSNGEPAIHIINSWSGNAIKTNVDSGGSNYIDITDGDWHFLTMAYDGSMNWDGVSFYIDGQQQAINNQNDNLTSTDVTYSNPLRFNGRSDDTGSQSSAGEVKLAHFMLFKNRELTQAEHTAMYNKLKP